MSYSGFESLESRRFFAAITSLTLFNADTDTPIAGYENLAPGAVLNLATLPTTRLNVLANVTADVSCVNFGYDGNPNHALENNAPFAFASDAANDIKPWTPTLGAHTLTATPYTADNKLGTAGETKTITFSVVSIPPAEPEPQPPAVAPAVTSFTLINAVTDQPIPGFENLLSGAVLNLATLPTTQLNVRANVTTDVSSVNFGYDANPNFLLENTAPYAFAMDTAGDYKPWTPTVGSHTITATPYTADNKLGTAGAARTFTFTVINVVPGPNPEPPPPQPTPVKAPVVTSTTVGTTGLKLAWPAPPASENVAKYVIRYTPGAYIAGPAGQTQTVEVAAPATSSTLANLAPFTLYSIDVSAVNKTGQSATTHVNVWTAAPAEDKRYLYVVRLPKDKRGFTALKPQIEVFDIANGHQWVKNIPLPTGIYSVRGVSANVATQKLFVSFFNTPKDGYQTGGLMCIDLRTNAVMWKKTYAASVVPSPDRFDITPDGKKIYMPAGENGTANFWVVIDAATGNAIGRITHVTAPHNTIVSVDGKLAFLEGQEKATQPAAWKHTVAVVDTATNTVIKRVGPFRDVVRPFTINGKATLIFATVNNFVGFQIADVATGKVIYTAQPTGYVQPDPPLGRSLSHGIAITPDEKTVWVVDGLKVGVHVWDVSKVPSQAPKYLGFVQTRHRGRNIAGQLDPAASQDVEGSPAWVNSSWDGKYVYAESGEIIDVATRKVIGQLRAKTTDALGNLIDAPYTHSRFMLELDFNPLGQVVRATDQFGIGLVR